MKRLRPSASGVTKRPKKRAATSKTGGRVAARRSAGVALAPELKYNDNSFTVDATTTGAIVALNQMAAGDTALLRDGNKILCKSVQLRFYMQLEDASVNAIVRMIVVWDRQPNLTTPSIATAGTGPLDTITIQSLRQVATASRFRVLSDKVYVLNQKNDTATSRQIIHDELYMKVPEECQLTSFADGTSANPISGGLYLMYFSNIAAGAADVDVFGQARVRFLG